MHTVGVFPLRQKTCVAGPVSIASLQTFTGIATTKTRKGGFMKYVFSVFCCVLVLLFATGGLFAQDSTRTMRRFRVLLTTGERIEGKNGVLSPTSLEGTASTGIPVNVQRSDIRALDAYMGSQAAKWGLAGAGLGLLTGLLAVVEVAANPDVILNEGAAAGVTAGLTICGGLIGLLVGSQDARWESVPVRKVTLIDPRPTGVIWMAELSF
jgi:hypothetical protein